MSLCIYTDGSFNRKWKVIGWGYCVVDPVKDECVCEESGNMTDSELVLHYQAPGESFACSEALRHAKDYFDKHGTPKEERIVHIYYDYMGVEMWATVEKKPWKRNYDFSEEYRKLMVDYQNDILIKWHKVKSHSGNKWNEYADQLAYKACTVLDH